MLNFRYLFSVGECGYFCVRKIVGKCKIENKKYMSLYEIKDNLNKKGYWCEGRLIDAINGVVGQCVSIVKKGKFNYHYVIIKRVTNKYVHIYDPLFLGVKRVKKERFIKKWIKICLFYEKIC